MPSKRPILKLSPEEELFLRRWMYDELHYEEGRGPAKLLQLEHRVPPAELGLFIAAAMPETSTQEAAALDPTPPERTIWPWTDETFPSRLAEARTILERRTEVLDVPT
jgi:hypothetical protein